MTQLVLLLAAATGVDYGWRHTEDGSLEYLIQIEPGLLRALAEGEPIVSEIHPDARGVTRFRVFVGNAQLPREAVQPIAPREAVGQQEPPIFPRLLPGPIPSPAPVENPPASIRPGAGVRLADDRVSPPPLLSPPEMSPTAPPKLDPPPTSTPPVVSPPASGTLADKPLGGDTRSGTELRPSQPLHTFPSETSRDPNVRPVGGISAPTSTTSDEQLVASADNPVMTSTTKSGDSDDETSSAGASSALIITVALLFLSLGANVFLGWIARGFYRRYRALADEIRNAPAVEPA